MKNQSTDPVQDTRKQAGRDSGGSLSTTSNYIAGDNITDHAVVAKEGGIAVGPGGTYNRQSTVEQRSHYEPQQWERIVTLVAALGWIGLVGYLVVRNEPLDPNLVVFVRILLSIFAGVLGATIPGFLSVSMKGAGLAVRAGGALSLFLISYFFTPEVIP